MTEHLDHIYSIPPVLNKWTIADLKGLVIDDGEQFTALERTFLATGKGRRPTLPALVINNKLLIQLYVLKEENNKPWVQLETWFSQIKSSDSYTVRNCVAKAVNSLNFLSRLDYVHHLEHVLDLDYISPELSAFGLNKDNLFSPPNEYTGPVQLVTNKFIIDFYSYSIKKKTALFTVDAIHRWLCLFSGGDVDKSFLKKNIDNVMRNYKNKYSKLKRRHPDCFEDFMNQTFRVDNPCSTEDNKPLFCDVDELKLKLQQALDDAELLRVRVYELEIEKAQLNEKLLIGQEELNTLKLNGDTVEHHLFVYPSDDFDP